MNTPNFFNGKTILVTGAAGFIGSYLSDRLCQENPEAKIIGFDSLNDYYDPKLKQHRLENLKQHKNFKIGRASCRERV